MVIQALRDNMPKWITGVILVIIIGPFALWGINSYFTASTDSSVATVNGDEISPGDFERAYQGQYERLQQFYGASFQPGMIDEKALRQQVLDQLINETLLNQQVEKQHYSVGDQQLGDAIRKMSAFQVGGKFSEQQYVAALSSSGMTPAEFERRDRQGIEVGQVQDAIQDSAIATPAALAAAVAVRGQEREIAYLEVHTVSLLGTQPVSDDDIAAYYKAHGKDFMTPEKVTLAYVDLDEANLAKDVKPTDADLQALYQQQLDSYKQGETREARHILIAVSGNDPKADAAAKAKAEDILKQLKAGADFAKLAKQYSDDPGSKNQGGDLGKVSRGVMVKPFEEALFGMAKPGDIAGPIRTQFGYHIIQLEGIDASTVKPFTEVKAQLLADYQKKKADDEYYNLGDQLANLAYEHPESLDEVSKQLNLPVQTVDGVTRDAGTGIAANADVRKAAFSDPVLAQGNNSQPIQLGPSHAVVVRAKGHVPSEPLPLEAVHTQIYNILKQQHATQQASALAISLGEQVKQGADPAALAKADKAKGVSYTAPAFVQRSQQNVSPQLLSSAFVAPDPATAGRSVQTVALDNGDQAVLIVSAMKPGDAGALKDADRLKQLQSLSREQGNAEFGAYLAYLRQQAKIKINTKNMEQSDQ
ncbi:MAG TPA: SurA N-terminal domain-containing protein [Gammaproteobacteria bacterium]|nr:SurA N-terminal domain-containing protein [Gammaproteobacteria bacterium]